MKYFPNILLTLAALSFCQYTLGQQDKSTERYHMHRIGGSDLVVKIPSEFTASETGQNEFVLREQGTVVKFAFLKDISASRFCDSMTTRYFESQGLTEVTETSTGEVTIFKGKFTINQMPYTRAFYVIPRKGSTILQISNYPEKLGEELEAELLQMIRHNGNE